MVKCTKGQIRRLKTALRWKGHPEQRQRIQMVLLRESGMTQPSIAEAMGVSLSTVNRAHMAYDHGGLKALQLKCQRGDQRGAHREARKSGKEEYLGWRVNPDASRVTSVSLLKAGGRRLRTTFDAVPRFALIVCCAFAGLRLTARPRLTRPSMGGRTQPSTAAGGLCSTAN